jgi:PAS domain S-box-containing protein
MFGLPSARYERRRMAFPDRYLELAKSAFGDARDDIRSVASRAEKLFDRPVIVWEGDAQTFAFSFVSPAAEKLLGHPARRWTTEPTFWADTVVHPEDRDDAVAYCALATGKCVDHAFVYRAQTADGRVRLLADYVQVVRGARSIAERLRGIMIDVTDDLADEDATRAWRSPTKRAVEEFSPTPR